MSAHLAALLFAMFAMQAERGASTTCQGILSASGIRKWAEPSGSRPSSSASPAPARGGGAARPAQRLPAASKKLEGTRHKLGAEVLGHKLVEPIVDQDPGRSKGGRVVVRAVEDQDVGSQ